MTPNITIKFYDSDQGVYFSGKVVSGKVEIVLQEEKKVRSIAINICGSSKAEWSNKLNALSVFTRRRNVHSTQFLGQEEYLSATTYLVGSDSATPTTLLPGLHIYNFVCALPPQAPSSFEGTHGHIRYEAKVVLDQPWKFNQTYTVGFTVLKMLDLNQESALLRVPIEADVVKTFGCGICKSNPIYLKASLFQTGFVPGQMIFIRTDINNSSNGQIADIRIFLRQVISYCANMPMTNYKEEIINIASKSSGHVDGNTTVQFEESLLIPAVPPTSDSHSNIIKISYDITVEAFFAFGWKNPFVTCPIIIGTVPLTDQSSTLNEQLAVTHSESGSSPSHLQTNSNEERRSSVPMIGPTLNKEAESVNCNISPPTYEESVELSQAMIDEATERITFVPRYPVYHFDIPVAKDKSEASPRY